MPLAAKNLRPLAAGLTAMLFLSTASAQTAAPAPKVFMTPWYGKVTCRRVKRSWAESVCAENNTDVLHQGFEHVPQALKPDF